MSALDDLIRYSRTPARLVDRASFELAELRAALTRIAEDLPEERQELSNWDVADVYDRLWKAGIEARKALAIFDAAHGPEER